MLQAADKRGPNIIVLSKAGKPIFSRYGSEEDLMPICGIAQAILATASTVSNQENDDNGIQFICAKNLKIAFLTVGFVTLIGVSEDEEITEPFLHLLLEYVYSQVVFTLTDQMQKVFQRTPSFDMRGLLGATERVLDGLLLNTASLITGGVEVFPLDPLLRNHVSDVICNSTKHIPETLLVILVVKNKLVTMLQSKRHRIHTMDLQLILNFLLHQPGLLDNESWIPICLPNFESSRYVYAYINRIEASVDLTFVCIAVQHNTAQFELYREACAAIQSFLGILHRNGSALKSMSSIIADSVAPSFSELSHHCPLVTTIRNTNLDSPQMKEYCQSESAMHFLFRWDVPDTQKRGKTGSFLTQFVQSSFQVPLIDFKSQQTVWCMYQKLALRLRNGSAKAEKCVVEMDRASSQHNNKKTKEIKDGNLACDGEIAVNDVQACLGRDMFGLLPPVNSISYSIQGSNMYIAINAKDCEMYAVLSSTISITSGASMCARLIGKLLSDRNVLFLDSIKTWR